MEGECEGCTKEEKRQFFLHKPVVTKQINNRKIGEPIVQPEQEGKE